MYPRVLMSLLSTVTLVACGSNSDTPPADGGSLDDAGATDGGAGEDAGADAGVVPVTTATVTFKGVTTTVPIAVRRGLSFFQRTGGPIATSTYGNATTLSCAPNAAFAAGGRVIAGSSISVGIAGPVVGNCAFNQAQIPAAEGQIAGFLRNQCGGGLATCVYDATAALDTYLGECSPQNLSLVVQYDCRAMDPGPAFVIDTGALGIILSGLEAPGSHSCAARGARFAVDGVAAAIETTAPCVIDITERDDRTLVGSVTATLAPAATGEPTRALSMTFEHNRNQLYPVVAVNTGTDLCLTNTVTHTVRTEAGETYDDFVGAAPVCQVAGSTLGDITFTRRRARTGSSLPQDVSCAEGRFNVAINGVGSTANNGGLCQAAYAVSESDEVLRFVTQTLDLCSSGGCVQRPFVYMAYGFGDASAPLL